MSFREDTPSRQLLNKGNAGTRLSRREEAVFGTLTSMEEPKINVVQDLYTSSDGNDTESIKYTADYVDPNDHTNDISEQADSPTEALERLYEALEHRGISRGHFPNRACSRPL